MARNVARFEAIGAFAFNPMTRLPVRGRNVESLDRLCELAERPSAAGAG